MPAQAAKMDLKTNCNEGKDNSDVGLAYKAGIHWGITGRPTFVASIIPQADESRYTGKVVAFLEEVLKGFKDGEKARDIQPLRDYSYPCDEAYTWQPSELPARCRECVYIKRCYREGEGFLKEKGLVFIVDG